MDSFDQFFQNLDNKAKADTEWFVSVADGVEGPFTEKELIIYIQQKRLSAQTLFWNKAMTDWVALSDLNHEAFIAVAATPAEIKVPFEVHSSTSSLKNLELWIDQQPEKKISIQAKKTVVKKEISKAQIALGAFTLLTGCLAIILLLQKYDSFPNIPELSPEQLRDLKAAQAESIKNGAVGAIHLLGANSSVPRFAITTNVKSPQSIILKMEGVAGTLIGYPKYVAMTRYTIKDGLLITNPAVNQKGELLPMGEYNISVMCESCPDHNGIDHNIRLAEKKYFIGGEKNMDYDNKLRTYHFQLKAQARDELIYFKQLSELLMDHYDQLRKIRIVERQGTVDAYNTQLAKTWSLNHSQYQIEFQSIAEKYKKGVFFYDKYISEMMQLFGSMNAIYNAKVEKAQMDEFVKLGLAFRDQYGKLNQHRIRLENLPLTANGRPRTD